MKPETQEWIDKAEGDRKVARREIQTADPVWNVVCLLAQQCTEKYLKGLLEEHNVAFQRTHDLLVLLQASRGLRSDLDSLRPQLVHLGTLGIATRYPRTQADEEAAENAIQTTEVVRTVVRTKLGLSGV